MLVDLVGRAELGPAARIVDAGCGTGANVTALATATPARVFGFDVAREAARYWANGQAPTCLASINEIPFATNSFDVALAVDVLETDTVRPATAYRELIRIVRPGGLVLIVVPAYRWMLSPEHHRAVQASRRYTRGRLRELLAQEPVTIVRTTYMFATIFPAFAAYRLYKRGTAKSLTDRPPRSEVWRFPAPLNALLLGLMTVERYLLRVMDFPWGSSIVAVVRKR